MKIYSRVQLIETVLIGTVFIIIWFASFVSGDRMGHSWIVSTVIIVARGLYDSFSEAGYKADQRRSITKRVCRKLFGKWAVIAPRVFEILVLLAWTCSTLVPSQMWFTLLLIMLAFGYEAWFTVTCNKHIKLEEDQEREQK